MALKRVTGIKSRPCYAEKVNFYFYDFVHYLNGNNRGNVSINYSNSCYVVISQPSLPLINNINKLHFEIIRIDTPPITRQKYDPVSAISPPKATIYPQPSTIPAQFRTSRDEAWHFAKAFTTQNFISPTLGISPLASIGTATPPPPLRCSKIKIIRTRKLGSPSKAALGARASRRERERETFS